MFRQLFSSGISEQARQHQISRNVSHDLEIPFLVHTQIDLDSSTSCTRFFQSHSRFPLSGGQSDPNGMVTPQRGFRANMSDMALARCRHVCNIPKQQAGDIHISHPRPKGLEGRCPQRFRGTNCTVMLSVQQPYFPSWFKRCGPTFVA